VNPPMFAKGARRIQLVMLSIALATFVLPLSFTTQAQAKKVLKYQASGEPNTMDPNLTSFADAVAYDYALFRSPLRYDKDNNPVPSIAKEVPTTANGDISADGKTYTYHLRNDWKWSDGNGVVKAQDFVYAWQRVVDPRLAAGYGSFFNGLLLNADTINNTDPTKVDQALLDTLGVKAVDDFTLQFTLVHPAGYWNQVMCLWLASAVRKDNVERKDPNGKALDPASAAWLDPANGPVVGSGPFILTRWDHNKELVFSKNPNFAGDTPKLDEIDLEVIQDSAAAFVGYKSGQLDIDLGFPTAELNNIKADPVLGKQLTIYPGSCEYYLGLDNTRPPFDNIDARKAFSYAFDRDSFVKTVEQGLWQKWLSFLPPAIAGADPTLGSAYDFNADQAKAALAKAGYPNGQGFPTTTFHFRAGTNGQRTADWIQAQYKKILNVNIAESPEDTASWEAAVTDPLNKQNGSYILGWCADYLHPSDWLIPVFGSNGAAGNANNASGFKNTDYEAAAMQADATLDPAAALKLYQKAQQILVDAVPAVFLGVPVNPVLVGPKVISSSLQTSGLDGGYIGSFFWENIDVQAS